MLRKVMIVLAKTAALTSGLTVQAFAHGDATLGGVVNGLGNLEAVLPGLR